MLRVVYITSIVSGWSGVMDLCTFLIRRVVTLSIIRQRSLEWGDGFVYVPDTTRRIVDITSIVLDWGGVTDLSAFLIRRVSLSILR